MGRRLLHFLPFFSVLSILHTWPLARYAGTRAVNLGDGILNVWLISSVARRFLAHPFSVFDVNMYYPYRHALASLDHQLTTALLATPLALLSDNALLPANLFTIASFALAGLFMALLVRDITGSTGAALLAGSVYAFSPMRLENILRTHVLADCWLPLALLALRAYVREPTWRRMWLATGAFLLLAMSSWYYAVIGGMGVMLVAVADARHRSSGLGLVAGRALAGLAVAAVVLVAAAWPYAQIGREFVPEPARAFGVTNAPPSHSIELPVDQEAVQRLSARVENYVAAAGSSHLPWSVRLSKLSPMTGSRFFPGVAAVTFAAIAIFSLCRGQVRASPLAWPALILAGVAGLAATGFFAALLASLLLWLLIKPPAAGASGAWLLDARAYLVLGCFGCLMSLGQEVSAFGVHLGAGTLPASLPPFNLLRAASRWGVLFSLSAAVLAGIGYALMERRLTTRALRSTVAICALLFTNAELLAAPIATDRVGRLPNVYEWLKHAPPGPVVDFPIHANPLALYWSLSHGHPMVNGAGAVQPALFHRLEQHDDLSPEMVEYLRAYFHPRYIVVNGQEYRDAQAQALEEALTANADQLRLVAQFGAQKVFEITGPSRGTQVLRSFQPWMTSGKSSVGVRAGIEPSTNRGTAILEVWGNGRLLGSVDAAQLAQHGGVLTAPLSVEPNRGLNVEVMADYTLSSAERPTIGTTGRMSSADISLTVTPDRTRLQVNGHVWIGEKGYTVVALPTDRRMPDVRVFNTSWSEDASHALADFIKAQPEGTIVAAATFFDASRALTEDAVRALATIGATGDLRGKFGWAHGVIGVKGASPGSAVESLGDAAAKCLLGDPRTLGVVVDDVWIR